MPLSPLTTLELGGPAEHFCEAHDAPQLEAALSWAAERALPVTLLGGGSNVVVPDAGLPGLTVALRLRGVARVRGTDHVLLTASSGEPFDALVADTVAAGLAGLECLSGIPGHVGATPIQNVGAYGQEVSQLIHAVRAFDRARRIVHDIPGAACGFAYRDSLFKREPDRHVLLSVTFQLRPDGAPVIRYPELAGRLGTAAPTVAEVRAAVLSLRRSKSMVIDALDENRRSVGSFFKNPIVPAAQAQRLSTRLVADGVVAQAIDVPCFEAGDGLRKLSAAWLIERAGFPRGYRRSAVGISTRHSLALVHHGGGTTSALLALSDAIREAVARRFGVELQLEPAVL